MLTPPEALLLGFFLGVSLAGAFVAFGYKLARAHEGQAREFNILSSTISKPDHD